mgnify:CR=1 FL=1
MFALPVLPAVISRLFSVPDPETTVTQVFSAKSVAEPSFNLNFCVPTPLTPE